MNGRTIGILGALCIGLVTAAPASAASASPAPVSVTADADAARALPDALTLLGDDTYPESIGAARNGDLYVGSIVTGAVFRFRSGTTTAETFVPAGVNLGTAGVLVDDRRRVLWTCGIDLSFQTPTVLRAFSLRTGAALASYTLPDRGVCADLVLVRGDVFLTDTTDPTASPALPGRILRLTTPRRSSAADGTLTVWSADPAFTGPNGGLQINGIAYDGRSTLYTTNYGSGTLVRVPIARDGSAGPAALVPLDRPLVNPDGIRMFGRNTLLVTENPDRLSVVDVRTGAITLIATPDQPTSVVRVGRSLWVTEGQVLRLQTGQPPRLPFTVRRVPVPRGV